MHPDRFFGLGFIALAGGLYALNWQLTDAPTLGDPGPTLLPSAIAVAMALLGLRLAIKPAADNLEADSEQPATLTRRQLLVGAGSVLNLLVYVVLLPLVGYLLSTLLFFAVGARLLGNGGARSLLVYGLASLAITLTSYGLLTGVLAIHLPSGVLFDWLGG